MEPEDFGIDFSALREVFQAESLELLGVVEEAALELEATGFRAVLIEDMFRAAHTIKGNARVVGLDQVSEFVHGFEDLLAALRDGSISPTPRLTTTILKTVDALRRIVPAAVSTGALTLSEADERLRDELTDLARAGGSAAEEGGSPAGRGAEAARCFPGEADKSGAPSRTIRVSTEKLDRLMDLVGEIAIARGRLTDQLEKEASSGRPGILESHRESDLLYMDLQELVMRARMIPLGPLFHEYQRTVRDLSLARGTSARLVVEGDDAEVDTGVMELLRDPLTHLVRNALTHGIEDAAARIEAGKPPVGKVTLRAFHDTGSVVVQVEDDGAGMQLDRILAKGRERGLVAPGDVPAEEDLLRLVFEHGFSTAGAIDEISGRGVGMDVVMRNVEQLRGKVDIASRPGKGTTVTLRFPLTLAIIDGFRMAVGPETYVVPLDAVVECIELPSDDRAESGPCGITQLRGKPLPFVDLRTLFGLATEAPHRQHILVIRHGERTAGLAADTLLGEAQVVIKPLGRLFQGIPGLAGTAILGSGRVAFVLDVSALLATVMPESRPASARDGN